MAHAGQRQRGDEHQSGADQAQDKTLIQEHRAVRSRRQCIDHVNGREYQTSPARNPCSRFDCERRAASDSADHRDTEANEFPRHIAEPRGVHNRASADR